MQYQSLEYVNGVLLFLIICNNYIEIAFSAIKQEMVVAYGFNIQDLNDSVVPYIFF